MVKVKTKLLSPDAKLPTKAHEHDAGYDIYAASDSIKEMDQRGYFYIYKTGLSIEIPNGYVGYIFPRSSISKTTFSLANSVGIIDANFRGEILFKFRDHASGFMPRLAYKKGDRIGQIIIMPIPQVEFELSEELSETDRGEGGFGSSGS